MQSANKNIKPKVIALRILTSLEKHSRTTENFQEAATILIQELNREPAKNNNQAINIPETVEAILKELITAAQEKCKKAFNNLERAKVQKNQNSDVLLNAASRTYHTAENLQWVCQVFVNHQSDLWDQQQLKLPEDTKITLTSNEQLDLNNSAIGSRLTFTEFDQYLKLKNPKTFEQTLKYDDLIKKIITDHYDGLNHPAFQLLIKERALIDQYFDSQNQQLKNQNDSYALITQHQQLISDYERAIQHVNINIKNINQKITDNKEILRLTQEIVLLEKELLSKQQTLQKINQEINQKQGQMLATEKKVVIDSSEIDAISTEIASLNSQIEEQKQQLKNAQQKFETEKSILQKQSEYLSNKLEKFTDERDDIKRKYDQLYHQLSDTEKFRFCFNQLSSAKIEGHEKTVLQERFHVTQGRLFLEDINNMGRGEDQSKNTKSIFQELYAKQNHPLTEVKQAGKQLCEIRNKLVTEIIEKLKDATPFYSGNLASAFNIVIETVKPYVDKLNQEFDANNNLYHNQNFEKPDNINEKLKQDNAVIQELRRQFITFTLGEVEKMLSQNNINQDDYLNQNIKRTVKLLCKKSNDTYINANGTLNDSRQAYENSCRNLKKLAATEYVKVNEKISEEQLQKSENIKLEDIQVIKELNQSADPVIIDKAVSYLNLNDFENFQKYSQHKYEFEFLEHYYQPSDSQAEKYGINHQPNSDNIDALKAAQNFDSESNKLIAEYNNLANRDKDNKNYPLILRYLQQERKRLLGHTDQVRATLFQKNNPINHETAIKTDALVNILKISCCNYLQHHKNDEIVQKFLKSLTNVDNQIPRSTETLKTQLDTVLTQLKDNDQSKQNPNADLNISEENNLKKDENEERSMTFEQLLNNELIKFEVLKQAILTAIQDYKTSGYSDKDIDIAKLTQEVEQANNRRELVALADKYKQLSVKSHGTGILRWIVNRVYQLHDAIFDNQWGKSRKHGALKTILEEQLNQSCSATFQQELNLFHKSNIIQTLANNMADY